MWANGASGPSVPLVTLRAVYAVVLTVIFTALGSIFRAGVYRYATTGDAPGHMDTDLLRSPPSGRADVPRAGWNPSSDPG